jgi:Zinc finger, C3HC4 type (RING finger)
MSPSFYAPFKVKNDHDNNCTVKSFLINSKWTCKRFVDEMKQAVVKNFSINKNKKLLFLFSRNEHFIQNEIIPFHSETNIIEFLNLGSTFQYNSLCFYVKQQNIQEEEEEKEEEESKAEEPGTEGFTVSFCAICLTSKKDVVFLPCRHLACCFTCSSNPLVTQCVLCRVPISQKVQIFV